MALRNQPYIPLYVQDYLTDEKLNMCSAASQGIFIKIMCMMHKSDEYGIILLKQKDKQNQSTCLNFATKLARLLPFDKAELKLAIQELVEEKVLYINGDKLYQKRMIYDNKISIIRAESGSKGGKKTQKDFAKAKIKASTEDESEIVIEDKIINIEFEKFWDLYDYKKNKLECEKLWNGIKKTHYKHIINDETRSLIMKRLPKYIQNTYKNNKFPGRQYPHTYLFGECWNDEVVENNKNLKREIIGYLYQCPECKEWFVHDEKVDNYMFNCPECIKTERMNGLMLSDSLEYIQTIYEE